ncbi:hypothetical protein [Kibdelosporangium phytohabitans]|uniref:hypothetical protein n=1 Tax=Kibdelosporangium phytohabitans TaxID=860235 RepID=UPI0015D07C48|nr:hypothetical protein [Kibdelosporangium phytohabitans]MBE1467473.1 hypothetical protein [Kibdelosporangium phytohabitans]
MIERYGRHDVVLLFSDTLIEEPSLYRFLHTSAQQMGVPLVRVADGRTPFDVYWDSHFLGNSRIAPCSKLLKQKPARQWLTEHAAPDIATLYVGIDATEARRVPAIRSGWHPWRVEFPLMSESKLTKAAMLDEARVLGLTPPEAYAEGFSHANCSGWCVRGGHGHWLRLLMIHPDRYHDYEQREQEFRAKHGDVAILKEQRGGVVRPLPLAELRRRHEQHHRTNEQTPSRRTSTRPTTAPPPVQPSSSTA